MEPSGAQGASESGAAATGSTSQTPSAFTTAPAPQYAGTSPFSVDSSPSMSAPLVNQRKAGRTRSKREKAVRKLASTPANLLKQSMRQLRQQANKLEAVVRDNVPGLSSAGSSRRLERRESVDPVQIAAGHAFRETRRQTKELEVMVRA